MVQYFPVITGSLTVQGNVLITGSINTTAGITGSFSGTATTALTASSVANLNQNVVVTGSLTTTGQIVAQTLNVQQVTSSIVYSSGSNIFGNSLSNLQQMTGSLLVTGSGTFSSTVNGTIINSTANTFRLNGNNALSLVTLGGQSVVKVNAAGFWGTQLVGANDQGILIDNAGNVGVGTTSPGQRLQVKDNSSYTAISVANVKGSPGGTASLQLGLNDGGFITDDASRIEARVVGNPNSALDFKVYGAGTITGLNTVMTLTGTGRVGIGIGNPAVSLDAGDRTDAIIVPRGTTAQRPSATAGLVRNNTSLQTLEYYNGTNWISLVPDGSSAGNAVTNLTQFDLLGKPAGVYWFAPPGYAGQIQLYYDASLQSLGYGWVQVFSSPFGGAATVNEIDKNLPLTQMIVRTSDGANWDTAGWNNGSYRRFVTRGTTEGAADLSTTGTKTGYRVFFGYAGGHGIYNTSQDTCNWGNSTGAIGAGYDGSCGSYPNNLRWGIGTSSANYTTINKTWQIWIRW